MRRLSRKRLAGLSASLCAACAAALLVGGGPSLRYHAPQGEGGVATVRERPEPTPGESSAVVSGQASENMPTTAGDAAPVPAPEEPDVAAPSEEAPYEPGVVLARLRDGVSAQEVAGALEAAFGDVGGASVREELAPGIVAISLEGGASVDGAIAELSQIDGLFEGVQPNFVYTALESGDETDPRVLADATSPEDPVDAPGAAALIAELPDLPIDDPRAGEQWALSSMRVFEAWALARGAAGADGRPVTVAVIDNGFDLGHDDLADNVVAPYDAYLDSDAPDAMQAQDHGTHVAGIISAVAGNGVGVAGVSYNARVMPIKVTNSIGDASTASLIRAYRYLTDHADEHNVRVVNISMGSVRSGGMDAALLARIDAADEAGIVTVAVAGNATTPGAGGRVPFDNCYPGEHGSVVSVINLARDGAGVVRHGSSNYNVDGERDKNISAPGSDILSTVVRGNGGYGTKTGTSMAAPQVSGVLALMFAANPRLGAADAKAILYATATRLGDPDATGFDPEYGYGEVDAAAAVAEAKRRLPVPVRGLALSAGSLALKLDAGPATLTATVSPEEADAAVSWSSSNARVATVEGGVVTPVGAGTAIVTARAEGYEARCRVTVIGCSVAYTTHVQNVGWQRSWARDGSTAGTTGRALRLEALRVKLENSALGGSVEYQTHVQNVGWERSWLRDGAMSGTSGRALRLEAVRIRLRGDMAERYDVWYRVHAQGFGWMGWAKNGASAGTAGCGYRLEGLQVALRRKDANGASSAPGPTAGAFRGLVSYQTHVQNVGWQAAVADGASSGTTGRGLRLEGIKISVPGVAYTGSVLYQTHVQNVGWERSWRRNGQLSGTSGRSLRLEAIRIRLDGELARHYDVWYRVHAQNFGWMGWAKNGASAGTAGYGYRLEAIQVQLRSKGSAAPGSMVNAFRS